jgi:predicted acylesterase/phospholipase RssA
MMVENKREDKCLGLAMEGGGDHGAWEAGALKTMHKYFPEGYDVLSGVSIGAVNALYLGSYSKEEHGKAVEGLEA